MHGAVVSQDAKFTWSGSSTMHSLWKLRKGHNPALAFGTPIPGKSGFVLNGSVDYVSPHQVLGWVWDSAAPSRRLNVVALNDAITVSAMVANLYRPDLAQDPY